MLNGKDASGELCVCTALELLLSRTKQHDEALMHLLAPAPEGNVSVQELLSLVLEGAVKAIVRQATLPLQTILKRCQFWAQE